MASTLISSLLKTDHPSGSKGVNQNLSEPKCLHLGQPVHDNSKTDVAAKTFTFGNRTSSAFTSSPVKGPTNWKWTRETEASADNSNPSNANDVSKQLAFGNMARPPSDRSIRGQPPFSQMHTKASAVKSSQSTNPTQKDWQIVSI